jgi:hypothetical protein
MISHGFFMHIFCSLMSFLYSIVALFEFTGFCNYFTIQLYVYIFQVLKVNNLQVIDIYSI